MGRPDINPDVSDDASIHPLFAAFEYSFPVYEMAKLRLQALHGDDSPAQGGLNTFWHQDRLATADDRWITTPNNDTLYSSAWVDLSQGPARVVIPPTDGRYLSLAFLDVYSNNFTWLSPRDIGSDGVELVLVGPGWTGELPRDQRVIQAPDADVMLFARTLVRGEEDLPAARLVQQGFSAAPMGHFPALPACPARSANPGEDFIRLVRDALQRNPPPSYESGLHPMLRRAGLIDGGDADHFMAAQWSECLPAFLKKLQVQARAVSQPVGGWIYGAAHIGTFGTAYRLRAAVALGGLLALPRSEAHYIGAASDSEGRDLHGDHIYRLELPSGGIPADAFWSLTMYELMPNGARFLARNPINRYMLSDRSDLQRRPDGAATVWISASVPPQALMSNWLPAPRAPFRLAVRAYHASPDLLAGRTRMAPLVRVASFEP